MTIIADNTFAAACYDGNSVEELESALSSGSDATDMRAWNITKQEWFDSINIALTALRDEH